MKVRAWQRNVVPSQEMWLRQVIAALIDICLDAMPFHVFYIMMEEGSEWDNECQLPWRCDALEWESAANDRR